MRSETTARTPGKAFRRCTSSAETVAEMALIRWKAWTLLARTPASSAATEAWALAMAAARAPAAWGVARNWLPKMTTTFLSRCCCSRARMAGLSWSRVFSLPSGKAPALRPAAWVLAAKAGERLASGRATARASAARPAVNRRTGYSFMFSNE